MSNDKVLIEYIEKAKQGDQRSFTYLFNRYYNLVKYVVYGIVKNESIAEEIVSTTFTKAFQRISTYVNYISFEMWLKKIASNSAIDYIRHVKNDEDLYYVDDELNYIQLESQEFDPESTMVGSEDREILLDKLARLRSTYRNALEMRYLRGMSYKDISETLGRPIGTIKSDLFKAKQKLKRFY